MPSLDSPFPLPGDPGLRVPPAAEVPADFPQLAPRPPDAHKGTFGHVLIVGGSTGMSGAVSLAGMAALRSGAGLVTLAVPEPCLPVVSSFEPSYMTVPLPSDPQGRIGEGAPEVLAPFLAKVDCLAVGPGLGRSPFLTRWIGELYETTPIPLVLDADALNGLAEHTELPRPLSHPDSAPRLLTPHPGEFRRLCPDAPSARDALERRARKWAEEWQVTLVLKGHHTFIAQPGREAHNHSGNPGMATGGSGDVLTGITAALLGQGLPAWDAARLACHVHGRAGDWGTANLGPTSLIASDLVRWLPIAWTECSGRPPPK
jgi:ADP-dependent NAD(P)H-hydrate dehydratase